VVCFVSDANGEEVAAVSGSIAVVASHGEEDGGG